MKARTASKHRVTKETDIKLSVNLDGQGRYVVSTTIPFFDHMLELFSKHSLVDLRIKASGDTHIDAHHLVEDIGIALGSAIDEALGNKKGIQRYGFFLLPMDEALSYVAGYSIGLDISIRGSEDRSFRKSPDSYSVLGPWLVTADEIPDPGVLDLQITVNDEQRQHSNTKYMILGVPELIELASAFYTLQPGDLIFTGTPEGVSPIQAGDRIVATIDTIGTMTVATRADATRAASEMSGATA